MIEAAAASSIALAPRSAPLRRLGVYLDGLGAQVASNGAPLHVWTSDLPPAALLPRFPGEPVRADVLRPPHVRGAGLDWPPEAAVGPTGAGRLPLAYAWSGLTEQTRWSWNSDAGASHSLTPAAALAAGLSGVLDAVRADPHARPATALVVPNALAQSAQQELLDACGVLGLQLKLLWRPVAAALVWLERFEPALIHELALGDREAADLVVGSLLSLHMGAEGAEAACLAVVARRAPDGAWSLVPGRRRPRAAESAPGAGRRQVERLVSALARDAGDDSAAAWWRLHWVDGDLNAALRVLRDPSHGDFDRVHRHWRHACASEEDSAQRAQQRALPLPPLAPRASVTDALHAALQGHDSASLLGVVVTGPLAATRVAGRTLASHILERALTACKRTLVEGLDLPLGALARGAERFLNKLDHDLVGFLDTLPRVQLAVVERGQPRWTPLLQEHDRWVEGGRPWRREPDLEGLEVAAGHEHLDLNVHHEEFATVRRVRTRLPAPLDAPERVRLAVSMEPAQGNARIEVLPERAGLFGRRRVWIEWRSMSDTGQDPGTYLIRNFPRILPPLLPRMATLEKWRRVERPLSEALTCWDVQGVRLRSLDLSLLIERLRDRQQNFHDRKTGSREASAVDSEGRPPPLPGAQAQIEQLAEIALRLLAKRKTATPQYLDLIRLLCYTSTAHPAFLEFLASRIDAMGTNLHAAEVNACGWCLRDPLVIGAFAEVTLERLEQSLKGATDWIRALAWVLRFRDEATRELSSRTCERLSAGLLRVFAAERAAARGKYTFRASCMGIVYLLRRRAFDNGFLEPDSPLAVRIKAEFRGAAEDARARRLQLIGGSIDLGSELQRLIDYIDRRGHGLPGMAW